jgi:hypothetical protein
MLEAAGVDVIAHELAILGTWGLVAFAIALRIFRWR